VSISLSRKEQLRPLYLQIMQSSAFQQAVTNHTNYIIARLSQGGLDGKLLDEIDNVVQPFAEEFPPDTTEEEFEFLATRMHDEMLAMALAGAVCSILLSDGAGGISGLPEAIARADQFAQKVKNLMQYNHQMLHTPATVN
jgi:hypothetical protein